MLRWRQSWAWTDDEEKLYVMLIRKHTNKPIYKLKILHLFSGRSRLGTVRIDREDFPEVTHKMEIIPSRNFKLPFPDNEFDVTIFDPPWINQFMIWTAKEVPRVTRELIIAITGNFWWEPSPEYRTKFALASIYVVKKVSPVAKLVFVYKRANQMLSL